jgi:hypothetical protein
LHHDRRGGPDGTDRTGDESGLTPADGPHHDVAPEVTAGDEVVVVGVEDDAVEVPFAAASEDPDVVRDEELPVVLDPVDEVVESTAARVAEAPGRSWATRIPMAAVAPVAVMIAPRVRNRNRAFAFSLSVGVLGWPGADMWRLLVRR